jgi:PAS domain S-box-containing protein
MMLRRGITFKLTLVFVAFAAVLMAGGGVLAYLAGRQLILDNILAELRIASSEKQAALDEWVAHLEMDVAAKAKSPALVSDVEEMLAAARGSPEAQAAHDRAAAELRARVGENQPYLRWLVIEPLEGQVIADNDGMEEGKYREDRIYFKNGKLGPYVQNVYYSAALQAPALTVSAPLTDAQGRLVAVLAARLDLNDMNAILQRRTGDRQTDDAYLINASSLFVTQPRLNVDLAVLSRGIHTVAAKRCLSGETGVLQADDYRGVPAIIDFSWMPARNMCLIVTVDQAEAFAPVVTMGRWVILGSGIAIAVVAVLAGALARTITRPVHALQAGAARFGRGELDVRLPETSSDELGDLAREFNLMAAALSREQTQLRHRLERMYALSSVLICTLGFDGFFKEVNPAFERVLGFRQDELLMAPFIEFVHPDDRAATQEAVATLADGQPVAGFENRYRCNDGSWKWLLWNAASEPRERLIYASAHDVTDRKAAEERLKTALADTERSNKELEQFAYVASHDLQEPLRMVSSYTQLLAKRLEGQLDQDTQDFIGFAVNGANRMQRLIQDLLMYSRVTARGRPYEPVDLHQVLGEAVVNLQAAITGSGALVSNGDLPTLNVDYAQLVQVFQNLIGNAIKFHEEGEAPRVHISARRDGEEWIISVKDNGIGIDPKHFSRLFVIFQRLHGPQQYPGTGIGLALCQRIIARHGGRIWVESAPGQGSEFRFTLKG